MDIRTFRRRAYQVFAKFHGALLIRTKGWPTWLGWGQRALVLETVGRRSGAVRAVPLLYMPSGDDFVILASNYGQERPPAWWFNLQDRPDADVLWSGKRLPVHARVAEGSERDELATKGKAYCAQWHEYLTTVERTVPIVVLERRPPT